MVFVSVTVRPSAAIRFCASVPVTVSLMPKNGMVTLGTDWPVSGLLVMSPSKGGYPALLLIIATAAAPASRP